MEDQYTNKERNRATYEKFENEKRKVQKKIVKEYLENINSSMRQYIDNPEEKIEQFLEKEKLKGNLKTPQKQGQHTYYAGCFCETCGKILHKQKNKLKLQNNFKNEAIKQPIKLEKFQEKVTL